MCGTVSRLPLCDTVSRQSLSDTGQTVSAQTIKTKFMNKDRKDKKGRAILMCAGEYEEMEILRYAEDLVAAVDGGLPRLLEAGLVPDLVLGDFDSLDRRYLPYIEMLEKTAPERIQRLPCEKDDTDTVHAARVCLERGFRELVIYGGLGGRLDHTIANVQTLAWIRRQGARGYLMGRNTLVSALCGEKIVFPEGFEGTFSVFALDGKVTGVTLEGMKYPLTEGTLVNFFPLGVSNEIRADQRASVAVRTGLALMILQTPAEKRVCHPQTLQRFKLEI